MDIFKLGFIFIAAVTLFNIYIHYKSSQLYEKTADLFKKGKENNFLERLYEKTKVIDNKNCSSDILYYLQEIENLTPWAIKMFDATTKFPSGILEGNLRHFGNFEECLDVKVSSAKIKGNENTSEENYYDFNGLYCLVTINFNINNSSDLNDTEKDFFQHKINFMLETMMQGRRDLENREKERDSKECMPVIPVFTVSQWAVCLPSTCKANDVEVYLNGVLSSITSKSLKVTVRVDKGACVSNSITEPTSSVLFKGGYSVLYTTTILFVLILIGTTYDLFKKKPAIEGKPILAKILLSFSIPANLKKILDSGSLKKPASQSQKVSKALDCVDGVRALSAIWVILNHKVLLFTQEPLFNKSYLKESLSSLFWMPLTGNSMSVDSFFLIGGLLRSYNYTRDLDQGNNNQISTLIQRYLRLTPAFAAVIWFYTFVLPHLFSGPDWDWYVTSASEDCKEDWLLNLFYVHNYFGFPRLCVLQSWYLAADMQLFIAAPIFIYPLWRTFTKLKGKVRYLGVLPLLTAILACMVAQFFITYLQGFPALYRVGSEDHILMKYIQHMHMATHTRMGPYLVGLLVGFILNKNRGESITMSKLGVCLGWISTFSMFLYVLYGPYSTLQPGTPLNPLPDSIFAGIHRTLWGMALGWLVFACCAGYGGVINKILSAKILHHLSNISYCMFLTHVAVLLTNLGGNRTSDYKDQYRLVREFIADVALTMVASTILYIVVEAPFSAITNIIFKKDQKKRLLLMKEEKNAKKK